jgi:hypothetical protein
MRITELTLIFNKPRMYRRGLSSTAICCLSFLSPLCAQTGKELVATACYNELHQRQQNALWESHVQRRTAGHIYLEEEIETVDGSIGRLLSVDGHEPSPSDRKQDDDRLRELMQNPKARLALKENREADERKLDDLLRVLPGAFLFEDQGKRGDMETLSFCPNPAFNPNNYEEKGTSRDERDSARRSSREAAGPAFWDANKASRFWLWANRSPRQRRHDPSE